MVRVYKNRFRISSKKFREILRLFLLDIEASKVSLIVNVSRNTINKIYTEIRKNIAVECERNSVFERGEMEFDESYFGVRRVSGKRGCGAKGKITVFRILKRDGKVHTQIVTNCSAKELLPIIEGKVDKDSVVYTDGFKCYDDLL